MHVTITLDKTAVAAGQDLHGEAVVTNTTSAAIMVKACPSDWLHVGLTNSQVSYEPLNSDVLCEPSIRLASGANRFPITVKTTYQACTGPLGEASPQVPACVSDQMPVLPSGVYQTKVETSGLPGTTPASPITVTVTD